VGDISKNFSTRFLEASQSTLSILAILSSELLSTFSSVVIAPSLYHFYFSFPKMIFVSSGSEELRERERQGRENGVMRERQKEKQLESTHIDIFEHSFFLFLSIDHRTTIDLCGKVDGFSDTSTLLMATLLNTSLYLSTTGLYLESPTALCVISAHSHDKKCFPAFLHICLKLIFN
jgi:hypothetical protein